MATPLVVPPDFLGQILPREANGVTTDWRVTKAAVELVREVNKAGRIYIMEGSGVGSTRNNMAAYNYTPENFDLPGVELVAIEEDSGEWHARIQDQFGHPPRPGPEAQALYQHRR
ncbi:MAG: hypothetical protein ACM3ZC_05010 [Bacteroidota bacterium]